MVNNFTQQNLVGLLDKYIVKPNNSKGVEGFLFDILDLEEMNLSSEITDHYIEDNSPIQDHIALRPEMFTLKGYVAELKDLLPSNNLLSLLTPRGLDTLTSIAPSFASQASRFYSKINSITSKVTSYINKATNVYNLLLGKNTSTLRQTEAYNTFYTYWYNRQLLTVETPFGVLTDMAIENIKARQSGDTRYISDFSVTFKKIRKAKVQTISTRSIGRFGDSILSKIRKGSTPGKPLFNNLPLTAGSLTKRFL